MLINPRELHQPIVKPGCVYERIVLWIDKAYIEGLGQDENTLTKCFDIQSPTHTNILRPTGIQRTGITELLENMINECYGDDYANELSATGVFLQLMVEINRLALQKKGSAEPVKDTLLVTQVLGFINEHYNEDLSLESIAQKFFVSKYRRYKRIQIYNVKALAQCKGAFVTGCGTRCGLPQMWLSGLC